MIGGFCGYSENTITDCYWDIETSGQTGSSGGIGKNTSEMKMQATFINWDFDTFWKIEENETYPKFLLVDFSANVVSGLVPLTVTFTNATTGWPDENAFILTHDWDFGDNSAHSMDMNPTHVYQTSGVFTVTLIENRNYVEGTKTKVSFIIVNEPNSSYWDIQTSGVLTSSEGEGKMTNEMKIKGTPNVFVNWDFDTIWFMNEPEI